MYDIMKTQTYLTHLQVKELNKLGIEFEDTVMAWIDAFGSSCICSPSLYTSEPTTLIPYAALRADEWRFNGDATHAPSLQEILDKLPQQLVTYVDGEPRNHSLTLWRTSDDWRVAYDDCCVAFYDGSLFVSDNPLTAAFELLKWMVVNYPELINKTK